ncbi:hypothetical protein [Microbacterium sp. Root553]|uniref:hypothetical protein n=1 Tax=Microbacterium sp. Root553 TaxID=1736556 RepID=UPI000A99CBEC|nr:hypothetical protein [Microbacterium sp. Root553]
MSMTGDHEGAGHDTAPPVLSARAIIARWGRAILDVPRGIWIAASTATAVLLVVGVTGGFTRATVHPPELGVGDEARMSTYAITVLGAEVATEIESEYLSADPGEKLLVMTTRMENLTDAPIGVGTTADRTKANFINTAGPLLELADATATDSVSVWRADGSAGQVILQPGVPSQVTFAWTVPEEALSDGEVSLDVHEAEVRRGTVILSSNAVSWRAAEVGARITVAAEDAR